jgi:DNA-directed RNA polymerase subunit M/transcription elongation factor TFIIS
MAFYFAPREARTTLVCPECGQALDIRRTCHEAYMQCSSCRRTFELSRFISQMDDVMEEFLEKLYVDRV